MSVMGQLVKIAMNKNSLIFTCICHQIVTNNHPTNCGIAMWGVGQWFISRGHAAASKLTKQEIT